MLTKIEAMNYRALRYVSQELRNFQVLVGPNASGKSTFLDVVALVADLLTKPSLLDAMRERSTDVLDLTWMRETNWFEIALEASVPAATLRPASHLRYELRLGIDERTEELILANETLWRLTNPTPKLTAPSRLTHQPQQRTPTGWRKILSKIEDGNDYFQGETSAWNNTFRLGPKRLALANLPEDEDRFPAAIWFKKLIGEGVQKITLNSAMLRRPSPPQSLRTFQADGSNLPWVIHELEQNYPERLAMWLEHIRTALPDIQGIRTVERPEDRHRYLKLTYASGLEVPSWTVSDGTLRLLALTILAYIPNLTGIYLIEEPENGIHPQAVETVLQSLSSVYDAQVLLATHSPVVLGNTDLEDLLCFSHTPEGATEIIAGIDHPRLQHWRGEVDLSVLFASGVLGA